MYSLWESIQWSEGVAEFTFRASRSRARWSFRSGRYIGLDIMGMHGLSRNFRLVINWEYPNFCNFTDMIWISQYKNPNSLWEMGFWLEHTPSINRDQLDHRFGLLSIICFPKFRQYRAASFPVSKVLTALNILAKMLFPFGEKIWNSNAQRLLFANW